MTRSSQFEFDMSSAGIAAVYKDGENITAAARDRDGSLETIERTDTAGQARQKPKRPSMYKVVMHDDNTTPVDFVIHLLQKFFDRSLLDAVQITAAIHNEGRAVAGVYAKDIAEAKTAEAQAYSSQTDHPHHGIRAGMPQKIQFRLTCEKE